jgi:hypothetical protein
MINKIKKTNIVYVRHLRSLLMKFNENDKLSQENVIIVYDMYQYIYGILKELYQLRHLDEYNRLIRVILKKIPELTRECIIHIQNNKNSEYNEIENYLKCIDQLAKCQQLANELA